MLTLVTGYWNLNTSKHCQESYRKWLKSALRIYAPMVAFVGSEHEKDFLLSCRPNCMQTYAIICPISEFTMLPPTPIAETHSVHCPHADLGRIWLEKLALVAKAAQVNPFQSEWFAWYDAGMCSYRNTAPPKKFFPALPLYTLDPKCLCYTETPENIGKTFDSVKSGTYTHHVTGTWMAHRELLPTLLPIFRAYIGIVRKECREKDTFMFLSDQVVWTRLFLDQPTLFHKIGAGYGTFPSLLGFGDTIPNKWVSMVLPVYNTDPAFMAEAFQSITAQTLVKSKQLGIQLVVINDGSNQECTQALKSILKTFTPFVQVNYYENERNLGLGETLKRGVSHCLHNLIFRMDADDIMRPERLAKQILYLESHPKSPACGTQIQSFESSTQKILSTSHLPTTILLDAYRKKPSYWFVAHPSMCYRRSALEKIGNYDPKHARMVEDFDLHLRLLREFGRVDNVDEVLLNYRVHPNQVTRTSGAPAPNKTWQHVQDELIKKWISIH